jgi:hypothetical protein
MVPDAYHRMHWVKVGGTSDEVISVCLTEPEEKGRRPLSPSPPGARSKLGGDAGGLELHREATHGARELKGPGTIVWRESRYSLV